MNKIFSISGLQEIYDNYDTFILDQWGVMHDGEKGFSNAIKCIDKLIAKKKNLIIISNSSKRKTLTINKLLELGFNASDFIEVMTSGEMIWQSLAKKNYEEIKNLGIKCYHIFDQSKEASNDFFKGLHNFEITEDIKKSDFILGCTPFNSMMIKDYIPILDFALESNITFVCANPDFETIKQEKKNFCVGTIAELYKNMGGKVFLLGKPVTNIYLESIKKIKNFKKARTLAIGDSIYHDIKGAINFGIDSLLITSTGIHHEIFDKNNLIWDIKRSPLLNIGVKPNFICSELIF